MHTNTTLTPLDPDLYYNTTTVSTDAYDYLMWWNQYLTIDVCTTARTINATNLSSNWGGSGCTSQWYDAQGMVS